MTALHAHGNEAVEENIDPSLALPNKQQQQNKTSNYKPQLAVHGQSTGVGAYQSSHTH